MDKTAKNTQIKPVDVQEGFLYFSQNGIIKSEQVPKYGTLELIYVDGELVRSRKTTDKKYN